MSELPHILFVETGYKYNIKNLYQRKCELLSKRFSGTVITFGECGEFRFDKICVKSAHIIQPYNFMYRLFDIVCKQYMMLRVLYHAWKEIKNQRREGRQFDLIVTYDPLTTGLFGVILSALFRIPLVVEINGDYTSWTNYSHIDNLFFRKLKRKLAIALEKFVLSHSTGVKLLYPSQIDSFKPLKNDPNIKVFPNYLDVSKFYSESEASVITIIGFPFEVKGIDIAISAFKKIESQFPNWRLEILGYYPDWELHKIEEMIVDSPSISRLRPVDRSEMPKYLSKVGVVLCASRTEGFPRVIKEAMYAGKPIIASNVGGIPDAINHEVNGLLFESENIDDLSDCMQRMLGDAQLRRSLSINAKNYADKHYTDTAFLNDVDGFYKDTITRLEVLSDRV